MVGNLVGPAYRAKVNYVVPANLVFPVIGQHLAVFFKLRGL